MKPADVTIIAHRGASAYEPENTLKAIERAIELDADLVEIDARLDKDAHVVAIHDERVDRTTDGKGPVEGMTLDRLKALNAGSGEKIPTLKEVLDLVAGKIGLVIEIKVPRAVETIVREVREKEVVTPVFTSFHLGRDRDKQTRSLEIGS